jgi:predicted transcriptional regulator
MVQSRTVEIDSAAADALESEARSRGLSLREFLEELARRDIPTLATELASLREVGRGPWSPEALAEDAREMAGFEESGEGVPFDEIVGWVESWGTPGEQPMPIPRKL